MDQVEHLTKDTQPKSFTRSTARHLRRKRLNEARKAEKQLLGFNEVSGHSVEQQGQISNLDNSKAEALTKSKARRLRKKAKLQDNCNIPSCYNTAYYEYVPILDPGLSKYTEINEYDPTPYNKFNQTITHLQFSVVHNLNNVQTLLCSINQTEFTDPILAEKESCCNKSDCDTVSNYKQKIDLGKASRSQICDAKYKDTVDSGYEKRLKTSESKSLDIESEEDSSDLSRSSDTSFLLSKLHEYIQWGRYVEEFVNSKNFAYAFKSKYAQARCACYDKILKRSKIRLDNSTETLNDIALSINPLPMIQLETKVQADNTKQDVELDRALTSLHESNEDTSSSTRLLLGEEEAIETKENTSIDDKAEEGNSELSNNNCTTESQFILDVIENSESGHRDNKELDPISTEAQGATQEPLITNTLSVQTEEIIAVPNSSSTVKYSLNGTASGVQATKIMSETVAKSHEKTREEIKAEREAKKAAKAAAKAKVKSAKLEARENSNHPLDDCEIGKKSEGIDQPDTANTAPGDFSKRMRASFPEVYNELTKQEHNAPAAKPDGKSKAALRAERRAKQEAQRAAKQESLMGKVKLKTDDKVTVRVPTLAQVSQVAGDSVKKATKKVVTKEDTHEVNLFKHLYHERELALINVPTVNSKIHPAIVRLGVQYENKVIVGSNARCVALLAAVKQLIQDFERPSQADFIRGLEASLQESAAYLHHCRPLAVSMQNALRHLKWQMTQLPSSTADEEAKDRLGNAIDTYILEQIQLAGKAISITIQTKISNGNVILTYGYSSLIHNILLDAHLAGKQFRVIVVDGRPWLEGKEQLRRLAKHGIECSYLLINALSYVMPEVSKVFLGAHAILANGAVMSRVGTAQVALMARAFNVPVLVACETHKSCERVQTDSIVYNELGDADELTRNFLAHTKTSLLAKWRAKKYLNLLNITYDVTPADLVTAVVTELAILPCTSVPVILRIKPSEI